MTRGGNTSGEPVVLIAMERGSVWPTWARGVVPGTVVLAQQTSEDVLAFAQRVVRRIARIHSGRQRLGRTVIAVADHIHHEAFVARCLMIQAAVRCSAVGNDAEVVLSVEDTINDELRHELLALAGAVCEQLDTGHAVGVRFGPGLRRARPAPAALAVAAAP